MPIASRVSTPIARSYLHDEYLNACEDALTREAFFRAKLYCDNLGRLPGDAGMLSGLLFPGNPPGKKKMEEVLSELQRNLLIFRYSSGSRKIIEICDTGINQTLVGNMNAKSEFPGAPQEMVADWENKTGRTWKPVAKAGTRMNTYSTENNETGEPNTRIYADEHVPPCAAGLGGVGSGGVGLGEVRKEGVGYDGAKPAPAASSSSLNSSGVTFDQVPSGRDEAGRLHAFTCGKFEAEMGFKGYKHKDEFLQIFALVADQRKDEQAGRTNAIDVMSHVVNLARKSEFPVPAGWIRGLSELRREEQKAAAR